MKEHQWSSEERRQRLAILVRQAPFLFAANVGNACIIAALVGGDVPAAFLWPWFAAAFLVAFYPLRAWWSGRRKTGRGSGSVRSMRRAAWQAAAAATIWGAASPLFAPHVSSDVNLMLHGMLGCIAVGGAVGLSAVPAAALGYSAILGAAPLVYFFGFAPGSQLWLGFGLLLFLMTVWAATRSVLWAASDATRRVADEAAQRTRAEARFEDFAQAASDWFWEADPAGRLVGLWAQGAQRPLSTSAQCEIASLLDLEPLDRSWQPRLRACIERRETVDGMLCALYVGTERRVFEFNALPVTASDGGFAGFRGTLVDLTDLVAAREQAERLEAALRDAINAMSEAFVLYDADDRLVVVDEKQVELYAAAGHLAVPGTRYEDLLRARVAAGCFEEAAGREEAFVRERLAVRQAGRREVVERWPDGRIFRLTERRTEAGGLVSLRTDVTALERALRQATDSERRFRDFAEASSDWLWETDAALRFTYMSPNVERIVGAPPEAHYGRTRQDLLGEGYDRTVWEGHLADLEARRPFRNFVYRRQLPGADRRWLSVSGVPAFDEAGGFLGYRGAAPDVTDLVEATEKLRLNEARLANVVDNLPATITLMDTEGRIQLVNRAMARRFRLEPSDFIGRTDRGVYDMLVARHPDSAEDLAATLALLNELTAETLRTNRACSGESSWRRGRETLHYMVTRFPINDAAGALVGIGSVAFELTEQRRLQKQLAQAQKMDAIGHLAGGIAHDFNNLLGVIVGNLDLILLGCDDHPEEREMLQHAIGAARRAGALTQQLLTFSRRQMLRSEPVDLNELIAGVSELLQRTLGDNIRVQLHLNAGLPRAIADAGQLESVIVNLAINARDAMVDGGTLTVRTDDVAVAEGEEATAGTPVAGRYVMLEVRDTGTGMSPDVLARCFEPFFTTKGPDKGSGLGLSMVYGFVEQSHGFLRITSEPGQGVTIRIYLPVEAAEAADAPADEAEVAPRAAAGAAILVVEDNPAYRAFAVTALKRFGHTVTDVESGEDALSLLKDGGRFDLLFTDLRLSGRLNGRELSRIVRRSYPGMAVLLTTGYAGALGDEVEDGVTTAVLGKPYRLAELQAALADVLGDGALAARGPGRARR